MICKSKSRNNSDYRRYLCSTGCFVIRFPHLPFYILHHKLHIFITNVNKHDLVPKYNQFYWNFFRVCLDLEKLKGKKKICKAIFFLLFSLRKSKGKKMERKNVRKTWIVIKKIFLSKYERKMKGKTILSHLLKIKNRLM